MTTEQLRRVKTSLVLATLLVAACSHTPPAKPLPPATAIPSVQIPAPEPEPSATSTPQADEDSAASTAKPDAGLTPEQYADLFDRVRAGFKLDDVDRFAVDQQLELVRRESGLPRVAPSAAPSSTFTTS